MGTIDWGYWSNLADVSVSEALMLSLGVSPQGESTMLALEDGRALTVAARQRRDFAVSAVQSHKLGHGHMEDGPLAYRVTLAEFRAWGESLPVPLTFPDEFPRAAPAPKPAAPDACTRWPWGDHETKLLRLLAEAARKWWMNYNPADPTTAPTNQAVSEWLQSQGVAERNAQVIATILRADDLPTGPRK